MKKSFTAFAILLSVILSACALRKGPTASADSSSASSGPEVATTLPDSGGPVSDSGGGSTVDPSSSASEIVLADKGKTFTFHVGDSFLLNLGADVYDWEVTIDNQNVFAMKMGVMVIQGAQGIYDALAPGTATLTAVGNPQCLQSSPPCGMPTVLFKITLIVQ